MTPAEMARAERAALIDEQQRVDTWLKSQQVHKSRLDEVSPRDRAAYAAAKVRKREIVGRIVALNESIRSAKESAVSDYLQSDDRRRAIRANAFLQAARIAEACSTAVEAADAIRNAMAAEASK